MKWWEILEIPYDSDLKTIKKAYAKLLKIYNPEDDPEGYQRLREAYDTAIKYAKNNRQQDLQIDLVENINDEVIILKDETDVDKEIIERQYQNTNNSYNQQSDNDINLQIEEFLDKLNAVYNDNSLKSDIKAWEELLNNDVVWNVYSSPIIEDYIFEFLLNHEDLPLNIWYILNYHFNWTNKEISLYEKYGGQTVEEVFKVLQNINQLKYEHIKEIDPNFIEKYLLLCKQGSEALKNRDYYEAQESLLEAYKIFSHDKELLMLLGQFYYKIRDLEKSVEFFKLAFVIDKSDLEIAFSIGNILGNMGRFAEALSYIELYLASNNNNQAALNNIGYCYYYTGNLVKAKESFEKWLKFQTKKNRRIEKYIKNIEAKLEGKNVKTLKFRIYNPKKKKTIKKKKQKTETSMKKGKIKAIIILVILTAIVFKITVIDKLPVNNTEKSKEQQNKNDKKDEIPSGDETVFKTIRTREDLRKVDYYINLRIYFDKVKATDYFKISEEFNGKNILSKKEIEDNKLQDKIESKIYVGIFDTGAVLFADKNYKEDAANKNAKYKIEGALCGIDGQTYENIKTQYESQNGNDKDWRNRVYIDCSPKEVERLRKHNESLEVHNGKRVKVVKTLKEFEESNYEALHSIYLTNIMPLNIYVNVDENGKFDFRKKEELNGESYKNKIYTKAFVGQIDGKNMMFIDSNFSMNNLDNNKGCTIGGYKYKFTVKEVIKLPTEKGQNVDFVDIEPYFIFNTNLRI